MAYSSVTTCSYQSAQIAAEGRDYVTSLDTKAVSAGQYSIVLRMAQLLESHPAWTIVQAVEAAQGLIRRSHMCFIPYDLKFLRAGGRVSNAAALCGDLLGIHPVIEIQDGRLIAVRKLRGRMGKLAPRLVTDYAEERGLSRDEVWLIWGPGFPEELRVLVEQSARSYGFRKITWIKTGGVITSHGGPGAFGVVGFAQ